MPDAVTWLDKVLAVPAIGVTTQSWLGFASGVWDALERVSEKWRNDGQGQFNIRVANAVEIRVERDRGLYIALSPSGVVVGYTFNLTMDQKPGALPQLVSNADPEKYSALLARSFDLFGDFLKTGLGVGKEHEVLRIGVACDSRLVESQAPPGVRRYMADLDAAARNKLLAIEGNLIAELERREDAHDQCHHLCSKNVPDRPDDLSLRLDWQRVWKAPRRRTSTQIVEEIEKAITCANAYMESFGSGEL